MKYTYRTGDGVGAIIRQGSGFHVVFCGEDLGEFGTAQLAADDVSAGYVDLPPRGVDLAKLGIPANIFRVDAVLILRRTLFLTYRDG